MRSRPLIVLFSTIFVVWSNAIFAQTPSPSPSAGKPDQKLDYSESVPYKPRIVPDDKALKRQRKNDERKALKKGQLAVATKDEPFTFNVSIFGANGSVIQDVKPSELHVFIDDVEQPITSVTADAPLNVVILVDVSPSAAYSLNDMKALATQIVEKLAPSDRVMIIQFAQSARVLTDLTGDQNAISRAIKHLEIGDGTAVYETISDLFRKRLASIEGPTSVVILTDAVDTVSRKSDYAGSLVDAEYGNATVIPVFFDTLSAQLKSAKNLPYPGWPLNQPGTMLTKDDRDRGINYLNELINFSGGRGVPFRPSSPENSTIATNIASWLRGQIFVTVKHPDLASTNTRLPVRIRVDRPGLSILAKGSYFSSN